MKFDFTYKTVRPLFALVALSISNMAYANDINIQIGADNNSVNNAFVQPQDPTLSGGGRDQTMQFGDVLLGSHYDDLQIGGLGTDILAPGRGDDIVIGGVEHFNPANRDRAFGGSGRDIFIWKPGDGSDLWNGGRDHDVVIFGLTGEVDDGEVNFGVSFDQQTAEIALDPETSLPLVDVTNSPGFCEVIDATYSPEAAAELAALNLDHLVRFSIRAVADAFESGEQNTDNGLRVTLHLKDVETLICTSRDGGEIEVIDLTSQPARLVASGVSPQELKAYIHNKKLRNRLGRIVF